MVRLLPLLLATSPATAFAFRLPFTAQKPLEAPTTTETTSESDLPQPACYTYNLPAPPVPAEWKCDILAWVRSPDLVPNTIVPADVRISANGTGCKDVEGWTVGLMFRERTYAKLRSPDAPPMPKKPLREEFNDTATNSIPRGFIFGFPGDTFEEAMDEYEEELANPLRWKLEAVERPVFLTNLTLDIPPESWLDDEWLDATSSFSVAMPNTNFPPRISSSGMLPADRQPEVSEENVLEYHVVATHRDGSLAYIPAGFTAFIPLQSPISPSKNSMEESQWPKQLQLVSPRPNPKDIQHATNDTDAPSEDEEFDMASTMVPPPCVRPSIESIHSRQDEGNFAKFDISFAKANAEEPIVQGHNTTLNVTITRTGNGSEYPLSLHFHHQILITYPWFINKMNDEDYRTLSGPALGSSNKDNHRTESRMGFPRMLMAPNETLIAAMPPINRDMFYIPDQSHKRYQFGGPKDVYEFQINVTIRHNDLPTFVASFETLRSALSFSLQTYFECEPKAETPQDRRRMLFEPSPIVRSEAEQAARARDLEWTEARPEIRRMPRLPSDKDDLAMDGRVQRLEHTGIVSLDVASPITSQPETLHYMEDGARGPFLVAGRVTKLDRPTTYPPLCTGTRKVKEEDDKRYKRGNEYYYGLIGRSGGRGSYAARMWLKAEIAKRGETKNEEGGQAYMIYGGDFD